MQVVYILIVMSTCLGLEELRPKGVFKQIIQDQLELIYTLVDCARQCANSVPDCDAFKFFRRTLKCDLLQLENRIPCAYTHSDTWRAV